MPFSSSPNRLLLLLKASTLHRTLPPILGMALAFWLSASAVAQESTPAAQKQKPAPVTTTVVVHGEANADYLPESVNVGGLDEQPLKNAPLSASVISRDLMNNQVSRLLSDVVKNDASVGDDYVPVGYYGWFSIRGYAIDLATGLKVDNLTIAGEQDVPLENKERVEVLNGLAGVESGVSSSGGLINYATKQVALIRAFDLSTDQFGTAYGAADLGRYFGKLKLVGARLNLAGERIATYMQGTDGWRGVGASEAELKISAKAELKGNFEYQHKTEADGSGFQLLGGTALPDINRVYRSTMLGQQAWMPPDTYDAFNAGARLNLTLSPKWTVYVQAGLSHSLIQDNVIFAYGPALDPVTYATNCTGAPDAPYNFFCPDGSYGIYDYRNPNELRTDAEAVAMATGEIRTGKVTHNVTAGGELFRRVVKMPGFYSALTPSTATIADGAVYDYVGAENIYQKNAPVAFNTSASLEYPMQQAGPQRLWVNTHERSFLVQDRAQIPGNIQLIAALRYDSLRDHNYSAYATDPTAGSVITHKPIWLPQFAATFNPAKSLTLYGTYGALLSLGPQAPWWVDNGSEYLAPFHTRQFEAGAKYQHDEALLVSGSYFRMRAPNFYPRIVAGPDDFCHAAAAGDACFEQKGRETHDGFELNAEGRAASWLRLSASAATIRAQATATGTAAYDGRQVINVPRFRSTVFADVRLPHWKGLYLMPGWSFTARKEATRDNTLSVPAANLFNLGLRYTPGGEQGRTSFRIYASNIGNKKYWSDTGANGGDSYLWLGAPAWVRASVHYTF